MSILSEEKKEQTIKDLIDFFATERDEEIGVIAAEKLLTHFLESAGKAIYNQAVEDAKNLVQKRIEDAYIDIDSSIRKE